MNMFVSAFTKTFGALLAASAIYQLGRFIAIRDVYNHGLTVCEIKIGCDEDEKEENK